MGEATIIFLLWLLGRSKPRSTNITINTTKGGAVPSTKSTPKTSEPIVPGGLPVSPTPVVDSAKGGASVGKQVTLILFDQAWEKRCRELLKRATTGARWVPDLERGGLAPDAAVSAARWIGIESGGNPLARSPLDERGLAQSMKHGHTAAEWAALANPKTTSDVHVKLAIKTITTAVKGTTGQTTLTPQTIGLGKLYHGLPLMVKELRNQGLLKETVAATLVAMIDGYKPSAKVASFVKGKNATLGNPVADLALRFVAAPAVIAYGDAALLATKES